jgi:hypothetical protein
MKNHEMRPNISNNIPLFQRTIPKHAHQQLGKSEKQTDAVLKIKIKSRSLATLACPYLPTI